jgi:hypothetical protein
MIFNFLIKILALQTADISYIEKHTHKLILSDDIYHEI